jgi:hypothetical protein
MGQSHIATKEPAMADYSKQFSSTAAKGTPRHKEHNAPGTDKNPFGGKKPKADLVAKLAEAARKGKGPKLPG